MGSTLKEIEETLPPSDSHVVDILGRLLWKSLIYQLPRETLDGKLAMGYPTTYIHRTLRAVAHLETIVPEDANGELDLRFQDIGLSHAPCLECTRRLPSAPAREPETSVALTTSRFSMKTGSAHRLLPALEPFVKPTPGGKTLLGQPREAPPHPERV